MSDASTLEPGRSRPGRCADFTPGSFSVFMPAYDAERHLEGVVRRIPSECLRAVRSIWIVNDGSTDGTGRVMDRLAAAEPRIRAVTFPENRGYGAAVRAALVRVREEPVQAAVCLHADGQYAPEEMPNLLRALRGRGLDLVQGSRIASGTALSGNMPLHKYLGGLVLTTMENVVFGMKMTDYHSGYLCFGRRALDGIPFERLSDSFDFDLEAIASALALGLRVGEVPVPTCYEDQVSHLNSFTYGLRVLRVMWRYATGHYRPRRASVRTAKDPTQRRASVRTAKDPTQRRARSCACLCGRASPARRQAELPV